MTDALKLKLSSLVTLDRCVHGFGDMQIIGKVIRYNSRFDEYLVLHDIDGREIWHHRECLTKLQEKPMQTIDIKAGDTVRILPDAKEIFKKLGWVTFYCVSHTVGWVGVVDRIGELSARVLFSDSINESWVYPIEALEKVTQEAEAQEIKLEVGPFYNIDCDVENPCKLIYQEDKNYLFNDSHNLPFWVSGADMSRFIEKGGIKKHSEPFKHTFTAKVVYCKEHHKQPYVLRDNQNILTCSCANTMEQAEITITEKSN